MRSVRARLLPGLAGATAVLVALAGRRRPDPGRLGWRARLRRGDRWSSSVEPSRARVALRARPADQVTLARAALVGGVAALVAGLLHADRSTSRSSSAWPRWRWPWTASTGRLARRTRTASALGARFDLEVDAFLILVLSVYAARSLGAWVLLIGAGALPAARSPGWSGRGCGGRRPPRYWAKVVAATQGVVLTVVAAGRPAPPGRAGRDRGGARPAGRVVRAPGGVARSGAVPRGTTRRVPGASPSPRWCWSGSPWPGRTGSDRLTPGDVRPDPGRGSGPRGGGAAAAGPARGRSWPPLAGGALGVLVLLKALDMGYYAELDRAFNPVIEWSSLGPAVGVLRDSVGPARAYAEVGGAVLLAVAVVALLGLGGAAGRPGSAPPTGAARPGSWARWPWCGSASAAIGVDVAPHDPGRVGVHDRLRRDRGAQRRCGVA